ncbi:unnamed protein product [Effrenium voratum]|nr:unnamed protein product [Effrenium voratum]
MTMKRADSISAGIAEGIRLQKSQSVASLGLEDALEPHPPVNPIVEQQEVAPIMTSASQHPRFPKEWSAARRCAARLTTNVYFDITIGVIVLTNIGLIVHQTNLTGPDCASGTAGCVDPVIGTFNLVFLFVYTFEALLRLAAFRIAYFYSSWNRLDFCVLSVDWILQIIAIVLAGESFKADLFRILRVIRALRVLRSIRTLPLFRELYIMLYGFLSAAKAIAWAAVLLMLILMIMGIIAVEWVHPIAKDLSEAGVFPEECVRCHRAFETVWASALTFSQQIVAGDSWGQVTIPIMESNPETVPYFMVVFITIDLGLLNLILSVIVDKAHQAQQEDIKFQLTQRQAAFEGARRNLLALCEELDEDASGCLSLDELLSGYDRLPEFQEQMRLMDVEREDMASLFRVLDEDGSGDIEYNEFVEQVVKMRSQDTTLSLLFLRSQIKDIKHHLQDVVNEVGGLRKETSVHASASQQMGSLMLSARREANEAKAAKLAARSTSSQTEGPQLVELAAEPNEDTDAGNPWLLHLQTLKSSVVHLERLAASNMDLVAGSAPSAEPKAFMDRCCTVQRPQGPHARAGSAGPGKYSRV